jgi:hypothetical protein
MVAFAEVLTVIVGIYVAAGVLFAVPFVLRGVNRIDPVARDGTWGFRLIVAPGVVALWPLLALRWLRGTQPPEERNAHRAAAKRGLR